MVSAQHNRALSSGAGPVHALIDELIPSTHLGTTWKGTGGRARERKREREGEDGVGQCWDTRD